MYTTALVPAVAITIARFFITGSANRRNAETYLDTAGFIPLSSAR